MSSLHAQPERGGILIVDKAEGMTSHDVVGTARRALRTRAVGHAGTLDPMATGVLVLASGAATRLLHFLTLDDKRYRATIQLGVATDSLDREGAETGRASVPSGLDLASVSEVARAFLGPQRQEAPVISAIKRGGEPLHRKVRRGETVEAPIRDVVVHRLEILAVRPDAIDLDVRCGKGFYVRALARDLAAALGTLGHLTALRRLQSGPYGLERAVPMALLQDARTDEDTRSELLGTMLSPAQAVAGMPQVTVNETGVAHLRHGRPMPLEALTGALTPPPAGPDPVAALSQDGELVAIVRREPDHLQVLRGFPNP